jgi:phosphoadenosine phosphosulfate reductase
MAMPDAEYLAEPAEPDPMEQEAARAAGELADADPGEILRWATARFQDRICVTSSMTDAVIVHMAAVIRPGIDVVFLDTGYHFAETLGTLGATPTCAVTCVRLSRSIARYTDTRRGSPACGGKRPSSAARRGRWSGTPGGRW